MIDYFIYDGLLRPLRLFPNLPPPSLPPNLPSPVRDSPKRTSYPTSAIALPRRSTSRLCSLMLLASCLPAAPFHRSLLASTSYSRSLPPLLPFSCPPQNPLGAACVRRVHRLACGRLEGADSCRRTTLQHGQVSPVGDSHAPPSSRAIHNARNGRDDQSVPGEPAILAFSASSVKLRLLPVRNRAAEHNTGNQGKGRRHRGHCTVMVEGRIDKNSEEVAPSLILVVVGVDAHECHDQQRHCDHMKYLSPSR